MGSLLGAAEILLACWVFVLEPFWSLVRGFVEALFGLCCSFLKPVKGELFWVAEALLGCWGLFWECFGRSGALLVWGSGA